MAATTDEVKQRELKPIVGLLAISIFWLWAGNHVAHASQAPSHLAMATASAIAVISSIIALLISRVMCQPPESRPFLRTSYVLAAVPITISTVILIHWA